MHGLFYTNSIKSCLRSFACMKDGKNKYLLEVSRLFASDSAEQVVFGGAETQLKCVYML